MNFREKLVNVFSLLGLTQKAKDNSLSNDEWKSVVDRFQKEYKVTLREAMEEESTNTPAITQEEITNAYNLVNGLLHTEETSASAEVPANGDEPAAEETTATQTSTEQASAEQPTFQQVVSMLGDLGKKITAMANRTAPDKPLQTTAPVAVHGVNGPADTSRFLFGIESPYFSMENRWNQITANPAVASLSSPTKAQESAFYNEFVDFSQSLQERYAYLHKQNLLGDVSALAKGEYTANYTGVTSLPGGNQFVVLRQDALIARVLAKRDLTVYFPVRYGVQDTDLIFNAFFNEVSQAYQAGDVYKGGADIQPERGYVDDAMIKLRFGSMKELERMYIGYLNKEGSDPIKWSMIEFFVLNSLETAQVEQNKRRMRGIYAKPEVGVAGSYLNTSTGIIHTLIRYNHEHKLLAHDDVAYSTYTSADMLEAVQAFVSDVQESISEDMDLDKMCIYLNKNHQSWYLANVRKAYGKDTDFSGPESYKNVVPDTNLHIIWLPYEGQLPLMFIQEPGNLQFLEFLPGEMMSINVSTDMELVKAWSTWKEGCSAAFVGKNFVNHDKLVANNYEFQQIFMNKPCVQLEKDATTCDASKGFWFLSQDNNSSPKNITDIKGAKKGVAYIIECGSTTQATTVNQSGKFTTISSGFTPEKVGDYLMVILKSDNNFAELERCVNGVRTVNAELQPNNPACRK